MECPDVWSLLLGAFGLLLLRECWRLWYPKHRRPPGPFPLPFIGNVLQLNFRDPLADVARLQQTYGDMYTIFVGRNPMVFLNGYQVTKEALVQSAEVFAGRPSMPILDWLSPGQGIGMAQYGHFWKQQRRFALTTLRNFGLGKKSGEARISEEARFLLQAFHEEGGKPFDPQLKVTNAVSNIICSLVFGKRFDYSSDRFQKLLHLMHDNMKLMSGLAAVAVNMCPILTHFPGPHQQIKKNSDEVYRFGNEAIQEHLKTLDPDNPRDYIDAYLLEMQKQSSNPDSAFSAVNLQACIWDLFIAGTDTTSTVLRWGFLYMITNPDVQARCQQEIEQVVGSDRLPAWEDRLMMHYVEATINEILRFGNIAPTGIMRAVIEDTVLRGYHLPKGTTVVVNLTSILFDPSVWKDPHHFNPENFLDEQGRFVKLESMIPFSVGLRVCPGEHLARMELFIFFTSILQNMDIVCSDESSRPDLTYEIGQVRSPLPYKLNFKTRPQSFLKTADS